jgi:hypothetical protein
MKKENISIKYALTTSPLPSPLRGEGVLEDKVEDVVID